MEKLYCVSFIGRLRHLGVDKNLISIRMECESKVFEYHDENDAQYERKEKKTFKHKLFVDVQEEQLETPGEPLGCFMPGDLIELNRLEEKIRVDFVEKHTYMLSNLTLYPEGSREEWEDVEYLK
ncbi:MAG: hypothetical protein IJ660_03775 [Alphaproteobacteria bacterium]|nr:hypothetical protein [Alphaproteobacteria bacterium]